MPSNYAAHPYAGLTEGPGNACALHEIAFPHTNKNELKKNIQRAETKNKKQLLTLNEKKIQWIL